MPDKPPPLKCISIILCDEVTRIHNSWNFIIHRTFHEFFTSAFPFQFPRITVFHTLTGGHGTYDMECAIVNARAGMDLMVARSQLTATDPLGLTDMQVVLRNIPIPEAGKYWVELRCSGELVAQRPFYVRLMSGKKPKADRPG